MAYPSPDSGGIQDLFPACIDCVSRLHLYSNPTSIGESLPTNAQALPSRIFLHSFQQCSLGSYRERTRQREDMRKSGYPHIIVLSLHTHTDCLSRLHKPNIYSGVFTPQMHRRALSVLSVFINTRQLGKRHAKTRMPLLHYQQQQHKTTRILETNHYTRLRVACRSVLLLGCFGTRPSETRSWWEREALSRRWECVLGSW